METFKVSQYVSKDGKIKSFDDNNYRITKTNNYLLRIQNLFLHYMKGCNIIKFPLNTLGDESHHLHLAPTHYCDNYYQYVLERIKNICIHSSDYTGNESCIVMQKNNVNMFNLIERRGLTPQLSSALQIEDRIIVTWIPVSRQTNGYKIYKDQGEGWKLIGESRYSYYIDTHVDEKKSGRYTVRADYGTELSSFDKDGIKIVDIKKEGI